MTPQQRLDAADRPKGTTTPLDRLMVAAKRLAEVTVPANTPIADLTADRFSRWRAAISELEDAALSFAADVLKQGGKAR